MSAFLADITNLTPHPVTILTLDGERELETIPSSGSIRLNENVTELGDGILFRSFAIPLLHITFEADNAISDWPERDNHFYIVSALVANAYPERTDFLMVAKTVRDDEGRIKGCTAFASATGEV
jgi:hypothetical protein